MTEPGNSTWGISQAGLWLVLMSPTLELVVKPPPSLGQSCVIWSSHIWLSGILFLSPFRSKYISICSRYGWETSAFPSSRTGWSVCSEWLHSKADTKGCSHPADYILLHGQFLSWSRLKHPHSPAFWNKHVQHLSSYLPTWPRSESADWK